MPRYIDADAIHYVEVGKGVEIALASDIDKMPTVSPDDVRGVGEWVGEYDGYYDGEPVWDMWSCSECGEYFDEWDDRPTWKYCPSCGARMKGAEDEHD